MNCINKLSLSFDTVRGLQYFFAATSAPSMEAAQWPKRDNVSFPVHSWQTPAAIVCSTAEFSNGASHFRKSRRNSQNDETEYPCFTVFDYAGCGPRDRRRGPVQHRSAVRLWLAGHQ